MSARDVAEAHRALLVQRFPDLALDTLEPIGDGWASYTYVLNDDRIAQIPRTPEATDAMRTQIAVLPELAREVSARIPVPERTSLGDPPVMIYERLPGTPCDRAPDGIWPERLGRFLHDLHSVPPEFVGMRLIPAGDIRRALVQELEGLTAHVLPRLDAADADRARAMVTTYLEDDGLWSFAPVLAHRDLGPQHVLVDDAGDLAGVLDWEEVGIGDPVWDFAWWVHEMPGPGERALAAYGGAPDQGFRERARYAYALMPWHEVEYGLDSGREGFVTSGLEGVRARLT